MNNSRAYTLIELLIVLAIIALMAAFGVPALKEMLTNTNDKIALSQLMQLLQQAQHETSLRRLPIAFCKSDDHLLCDKNANDLLLFINEKEDGKVANKKNILRIVQTAKYKNLHWRIYPYYRDYFLFFPSTIIANDNGTLWFCKDAKPLWAISLSKTSHLRVSYPDENGRLNDSKGKALVC